MRTIIMVDEEGRPFNRTYPRRAEHLVKKGRARWRDKTTIQVKSPLPPQETETEERAVNGQEPRKDIDIAVEAFEFIKGSQVEPIVKNDQIIRLIEATASRESMRILSQLTNDSLRDELALASIQAIEKLDMFPHEKSFHISEIATKCSFQRSVTIDRLRKLMATATGNNFFTEQDEED